MRGGASEPLAVAGGPRFVPESRTHACCKGTLQGVLCRQFRLLTFWPVAGLVTPSPAWLEAASTHSWQGSRGGPPCQLPLLGTLACVPAATRRFDPQSGSYATVWEAPGSLAGPLSWECQLCDLTQTHTALLAFLQDLLGNTHLDVYGVPAGRTAVRVEPGGRSRLAA